MTRATPIVFGLDLSPYSMPPVRVAFGPVVDGRATEIHTDFGGQPWSLIRVPDGGTRRAWLGPAVGALAAAGVATVVRRRSRRRRKADVRTSGAHRR